MLKTEGTDHKSPSLHRKRFDWSLFSRWNSSLTQPPVDTVAPSTLRPPSQIAFHGLKVAEKGSPLLPRRVRLALISHGVWDAHGDLGGGK